MIRAIKDSYNGNEEDDGGVKAVEYDHSCGCTNNIKCSDDQLFLKACFPDTSVLALDPKTLTEVYRVELPTAPRWFITHSTVVYCILCDSIKGYDSLHKKVIYNHQLKVDLEVRCVHMPPGEGSKIYIGFRGGIYVFDLVKQTFTAPAELTATPASSLAEV
ncbi:uncharacterized protein BJ171DRAFT_39105 [Polychytrium aggregatum]|uniref:uncharacterized protein n=1 Tax=Polychytrium aggregatum TaxID=110093 RepID=UPI0022FE9776|nr:uncharacterized protein BJ171DRAFT_39105 [Polychytrium aggregatum]KAI9205991.1 hypothetical protein BJ171DRAFT_39105 [Polychytrium aggregatum]